MDDKNTAATGKPAADKTTPAFASIDAPADKTTAATGKTPPALPVMDESFAPATGKNPPEGKTVEGWHSNEIIKCRKVDGTWENEDGETIQVEGWRLIEKPKEGEPPPWEPPPRPKKETARYTAPRKVPRKKK